MEDIQSTKNVEASGIAPSAPKQGKKKFFPKTKPIKVDAPNRQAKPPRPPVEANLTEDSLKPKHKSTTFTKPINDPADVEDFKVLGFEGFGSRKPRSRLRLDYSSYLDVIDETYTQMKATDKYIERAVSHSMFSYYCIVLLYQRIYTVRSDQGHDFNDLKSEIDRALAFEPSIPKPVAHFLNQIGKFTDNARRQWIIDFFDLNEQVYDTLSGHYGRVNADSHYRYSSQPAPYVSAMRIIYDYVYSSNSQANLVGFDRNWGLHQDLNPQNVRTRHPNENLLGWHKAVKTRPEITSLVESFGVDADWVLADGIVPAHLVVNSFGRNIGPIPINGEMLGFISTRLQQGSVVIGCNPSPVGSQTIIPFTIVEGDVEGSLRSTQGTCDTVSSTQLVATRASAAAVVRLRIRRKDVPSNYCYVFQDGYIRPNAWANTLNVNLVHEQGNWLNYDIFGLNQYRGIEASRAFVTNVLNR